jgi:hypothetical protein
MYIKLVLNELKVIGNSTFICTYWTPNSKKFLKKLVVYMCPMFTHVRSCVFHVYAMCTHVWIMNELRFN